MITGITRTGILCAGTWMLSMIAGCTKDGGTHPDKNANFTINMRRELTKVGDYKLVNRIMVIREGNGNTAADFVALSGICTFDDCTLGRYNKATGFLECFCDNGSTYDLSGACVTGPAKHPLRKYMTLIENDTTLRIHDTE